MAKRVYSDVARNAVYSGEHIRTYRCLKTTSASPFSTFCFSQTLVLLTLRLMIETHYFVDVGVKADAILAHPAQISKTEMRKQANWVTRITEVLEQIFNTRKVEVKLLRDPC